MCHYCNLDITKSTLLLRLLLPLTFTVETVLLPYAPTSPLSAILLPVQPLLPAAEAQALPVSFLLQNTTDTKQLHKTDFTEDVTNENRQSYYNLGQEIISNATSDIIVPRNALAIPSMRHFSLTASLLGTLRVPEIQRCPQKIQNYPIFLGGWNYHLLRARDFTNCLCYLPNLLNSTVGDTLVLHMRKLRLRGSDLAQDT